MSNTNYNKMSRNTSTKRAKEKKDIGIAPNIKEETHKGSLIMGIVSNCSSLNIRKEPNLKSHILGAINKGTSLTINYDLSTDEFYAVSVLLSDELVNGYCVKSFIDII